jgi:hypothetical protein
VHELDGDAGGEAGLPSVRRAQEDEHGPQALAAGGECLVPDRRDEARMRRDRAREPLLERVEVVGQPFDGADAGERLGCGGYSRASATWSATIPPAKRRYRTFPKPVSSSRRASASGAGKRRTLAGRYV